MKKSVKILIIVLIVLTVGIGGYFGYNALTKKEIEAMEGESAVEENATENKDLRTGSGIVKKLNYLYIHPEDGLAMNLDRVIANVNEKVTEIFKVSEDFKDFGIYVITAKNPDNVKPRVKGYKPTDPVFDRIYIYVVDKDKIGLKVGDTIKQVDAIKNLLFEERFAYYLPGLLTDISEGKYGDSRVGEFLKKYFTSEKINELRLDPNGRILLGYKK